MEDDDLEWEEWNPSQITFVNHMIAGSVAGLVEHVTIYPIDTIKTHIQYEKSASFKPLHTWNNAASFVKRDGFLRLWRGVSAMFAGCIPAHSAYFAVFEATKKLLGADTAGHHPIQAAACGALAAISHDMFLTPFDVVKQRMQLGYYKSVSHCVRTVFKTEGIAAFYMSFPTTLMMNIPFGGVMVAVNESVKKVLNPDGVHSISTSMIAGSIAGGIAAAATTPLDVVKTRLQTQNLEHCTKSCEDPLFNPTGSSSGGSSSNPGSAGNAGTSGVSRPNGVPPGGRSAMPHRGVRKGFSLPSGFPNTSAGAYPLDMAGATFAARSPISLHGSSGTRSVGGGSSVYARQRNAPTPAGLANERRAGVMFSRDRVPNIRMRALVTGTSAFPRHMYVAHTRRRSIRSLTWNNMRQGGASAFTSSSGAGAAVGQAGVRSLGMIEMAKLIYIKEGPAAFFRGMIPRMLVHAPSVAISWTAYETMKSFLMENNN